MTYQPQWEEQFDKIQGETVYMQYTEKRFCCGGDYCEGDHLGFIKGFIREQLALARLSTIDECIAIAHDKIEEGYEGIEQALQNLKKS